MRRVHMLTKRQLRGVLLKGSLLALVLLTASYRDTKHTSQQPSRVASAYWRAVLQARINNDGTASHSSASNESHPVAPQASGSAVNVARQLEQEFRRRHQHLVETCQRRNLTGVTVDAFLWWRYLLSTPGTLSTCAIAKVASLSLRKLHSHMEKSVAATPRPVRMMLVRHPLARLVAAYRDKFLDGAPLRVYDEDWQRREANEEPWKVHLISYWLPVLLSGGRVSPPPDLHHHLASHLRTYHLFLHTYYPKPVVVVPGDASPHHPLHTLTGLDPHTMAIQDLDYYLQLANMLLSKGKPGSLDHAVHGWGVPSTTPPPPVGLSMLNVGHKMADFGPSYGLYDAIYKSSLVSEGVEARLGNVTISFPEFLRHVVWTHQVGLTDPHWRTFIDYCLPCHNHPTHFRYVVKLEQVQQELSHVVNQVLGYPRQSSLTLPVIHPGPPHSHKRYYDQVPHHLMLQILDIYKDDLEMFEYDIKQYYTSH